MRSVEVVKLLIINLCSSTLWLLSVIILTPLLLCLVISDIFAIDVSLLNPNAQPAGPRRVAQPSATGGFNHDYNIVMVEQG